MPSADRLDYQNELGELSIILKGQRELGILSLSWGSLPPRLSLPFSGQPPSVLLLPPFPFPCHLGLWFPSLGIGILRERVLCLCQNWELTSISRTTPGSDLVPFKRMSCKEESSAPDAFQVPRKVTALKTDWGHEEFWLGSSLFRSCSALTRASPYKLPLRGEAVCPAWPLSWTGQANLIITMTAMAVSQKQKFRSHRTNWLPDVYVFYYKQMSISFVMVTKVVIFSYKIIGKDPTWHLFWHSWCERAVE